MQQIPQQKLSLTTKQKSIMHAHIALIINSENKNYNMKYKPLL